MTQRSSSQTQRGGFGFQIPQAQGGRPVVQHPGYPRGGRGGGRGGGGNPSRVGGGDTGWRAHSPRPQSHITTPAIDLTQGVPTRFLTSAVRYYEPDFDKQGLWQAHGLDKGQLGKAYDTALSELTAAGSFTGVDFGVRKGNKTEAVAIYLATVQFITAGKVKRYHTAWSMAGGFAKLTLALTQWETMTAEAKRTWTDDHPTAHVMFRIASLANAGAPLNRLSDAISEMFRAEKGGYSKDEKAALDELRTNLAKLANARRTVTGYHDAGRRLFKEFEAQLKASDNALLAEEQKITAFLGSQAGALSEDEVKKHTADWNRLVALGKEKGQHVISHEAYLGQMRLDKQDAAKKKLLADAKQFPVPDEYEKIVADTLGRATTLERFVTQYVPAVDEPLGEGGEQNEDGGGVDSRFIAEE